MVSHSVPLRTALGLSQISLLGVYNAGAQVVNHRKLLRVAFTM